MVMGVIVPIGKKRMALNRTRVCCQLNHPLENNNSRGLPKKVSFFFTEDDALRKVCLFLISAHAPSTHC